ncbi:universal stress protein [Haloferacaceae archaeon DSL9]
MRHALVVTGQTPHAEELVRRAGRFATGVGAKLTLLCVMSDGEYDARRDQLRSVSGYGTGYDIERARSDAKQRADEVGRAAFDGDAVTYEAVGAVGDVVETVLSIADARGCDHLFIVGRERSPTGKALFGDRAQRLILNFDGPVTIATAADA